MKLNKKHDLPTQSSSEEYPTPSVVFPVGHCVQLVEPCDEKDPSRQYEHVSFCWYVPDSHNTVEIKKQLLFQYSSKLPKRNESFEVEAFQCQ